MAVGRTFHVDVIMHTPQRFSAAVQAAIVGQLASLGPFRIAPRFHLFEEIEPQAMHDQLLRCLDTGSQGVVLKAADEPAVNLAVKQLIAAGIPVVTLVTDLPQSERIGYVGMDNRTAGQAAAYLMSRWLPTEAQDVAVVIGSECSAAKKSARWVFVPGCVAAPSTCEYWISAAATACMSAPLSE